MIPQVSPARRAQVVVILDHDIPAGSFQSAFRQKALIDFSRANSLEFIQSAGISYQLLMQGRLATGSLLVTCGQHVAQVGAIGALGLRFSPEELARWLQGGELTLPAPQPLHIRLEGDFAPGATAYDIALACAGKKGAEGRLLLLHDRTARGLTRAEKQTLCLMAQRAGAVSALFTAEDAPADTTLQLEDYPPCAILPGSLPEDPMEAQPLTALSDIRVDACFIGGCSSGRIEELREAAEILRGHHIRRELRLLIGFASNTDYLQAMEEGLIDAADIRRACIRVLRTRIRLGLFDPEPHFAACTYDTIASPAHKAVSLSCAEKSMVLLKNDGILPLDPSKLHAIAVIGPNADSRAALEGNYCGTADRYVTFLEGIQDAFSGRVHYAQGCHLYKDRTSNLAMADDRYAEALAAAEASDVVILCLGLDATLEGEEGDTGNEFSSGDKADLRLPPPQRKLLEKLHAVGKPVILVLAAGSALNPEISCNAVLQAWYPGQCGGQALAHILFGKVSPSGKLPVTFYETAEQLPNFTDYSMQNRTYRYARNNVLYPFGYGLTYGKIVCTELSYENGCARMTVTNQGIRFTEDVVQLYIKDNSPWAVPNHSLCGFARIGLEPGETRRLEIPVPDSAFESVDEQGVRAVTGTAFTLSAGTCQPDPLSEKLSGTMCVQVCIQK